MFATRCHTPACTNMYVIAVHQRPGSAPMSKPNQREAMSANSPTVNCRNITATLIAMSACTPASAVGCSCCS